MATYGKIGEFTESEESWTHYIERLEQYFLANEVDEVGKKRAILLSVCGSKTYALARDLLQPVRPAEATFKTIVDTLDKHFSPRPSEIVERFKFHSRNRKDGEGVRTYVAALRKLSEHCNYGETLPEMLRDRLVCGINDEKMQRRLLAEPDLTLKKAEEIALAMELASKHVVDIQSTDATPSKVNQVNSAARNKGRNPASNTECYRCGEKHEAFTCRFKDAQCFKCGKRGHLAKSCRNKSSGKINKGTEPVKRENKQPGHRGNKNKDEKKAQPTHLVEETCEEDDVYAETMYHIRGGNKLKAYEISIELCNAPHNFEVDTDAHGDVFSEGLGTLKGTTAKIYVDPEATPKFMKARPVPYALKAKVELELDRLQRENIISPIEFSEWAAPIVPVVKQDGSVRICGDYKGTVNQVSKLDNYPIPKTEDLLATLGGGNKFTKLDMSQAYQQLELEESSKKFTTINTHKGLYQYNRLPFGVSSAPGIFQRTMENLLQGIPHVVVRIDDILVSGKDELNHLANLEKVLSRLSSAGLRLRLDKCLFMQSSVTYCGYVINGDGIQLMAAKVEAIKNAPEPKDLVSQLRAFLGLLNYYHRFLPDVATVLEPLHQLLRKGSKWAWLEQQQTAFEEAKELLQSTDLLVHFDPEKELVLATDASDYGVGAVLSHKMKDGTERPIGYVSRSLQEAERKYSTLEKEALAIIFGVKKFHQFLYGHRFIIKTDHKPLEGLLNEKKGIPLQAAPRIQRWALTLASYEYEISYKAGQTNGNADGLSRLPLPVMPDSVPLPGETILLMEHLEGTPVHSGHIKAWTKRDPFLSQVIRYTLEGWPKAVNSEELTPYYTKRTELSVEDGCILWGTRVIVPPQGRSKVLSELHEAHPGESRMKALARSYVWWPGLDQDIVKKVKSCDEFQAHQRTPAEAPLHPWEWPGLPWSRLHVDYAGPYKGEMFLIVIDAYSKWLEVHCMKSTTSNATIEKLREIFATHGLPATLVSDNGSNFITSEFEEFMKQNGIKHIKVAPYHPASNGLAERAVRVFKEGFEKMGEGSIQTKISRFLLRYRTTPHSTTGVPPSELLMKRKLHTQLDRIFPSVADRVRSKQSKQKAVHDYHAKERTLEEVRAVHAKDFRYKKTWLPGTLVEKTGPVSARIQLDDGTVIRRHQDHVRVRESETATASITSEIPEATPVVISEPVAIFG
ncbi:LOW QUALITY PROTEIN: uncharacterized protein K02A2.6-like [Acropora millepora]|uniref:LOW QUALITY PROTEIN: uncharacterized protein K02A2.6-like n=1 Tax=Acropora millepora TaxID=45264 RepID=UPI001CF4D147|nr:LOW QUALITY PROTEIN: uncharacterized protein K02A2.6-like [Acropora millepora]